MLKVLVKKQLMEIFRSYFYNAKRIRHTQRVRRLRMLYCLLC